MAKESFKNARRRGYTTVENEILDDSAVSLEGKGLIAILLSNRNDWDIVMSNIVSRSKNGRDAHYNVLWHLIEQGYYARIYLKEGGKHKEVIHIFGAVKDDVKHEVEETINEIKKKKLQYDVEYKMKKSEKKTKKTSKGKEKAPLPENQDTVNPPLPENQDTVFQDTDSSDTESQYINKPKEEKPNLDKPKKENLNPNLNLDITDILWESTLPMDLKRKIKVKIYDKSLTLTSEQILLLEEAYKYQIDKGWIIPDCDKNYVGAINDAEFSGSIAKMLDSVSQIDNMKGLVQTWVQKAHEFKLVNLTKPEVGGEVPLFNWLES